MSKNQPSIEHWQPCPSGELSSLVESQKTTKKKAKISLYARTATATVLLISVATAYMLTRENHYGGISCSEVREHAAAYHGKSLTPELTAKVDEHLEQCTHCQEAFAKMAKRNPEKSKSEVMLALASKKQHPQSPISLLSSSSNSADDFLKDRAAWHREQWKAIRNKH